MNYDLAIIQDNLAKSHLKDWMNNMDIKNIYQEVEKLEPGQLYVEIGVAFGASMSVANLAAKPGVKLVGVDVINWPERDGNINQFLSFYNKTADWEFMEEDSQILAKYWRKGLIDVLYIDGDHTYEGCLRDIASWLPWVKSGGTIIFDDYNDVTGVKQCINDVLKGHKAFINHRVEDQTFICTKI